MLLSVWQKLRLVWRLCFCVECEAGASAAFNQPSDSGALVLLKFGTDRFVQKETTSRHGHFVQEYYCITTVTVSKRRQWKTAERLHKLLWCFCLIESACVQTCPYKSEGNFHCWSQKEKHSTGEPGNGDWGFVLRCKVTDWFLWLHTHTHFCHGFSCLSLQSYSMAVYLVRQQSSTVLLQRLRAKGIRNPDHSRALSKNRSQHYWIRLD